MAFTRMTWQEIKARKPQPNRAILDATTEEDIRRHMIEDGEDPDEEPQFGRPLDPAEVRGKLAMTQTEFAHLLGVPLARLREWEQQPAFVEPTANVLLRILLHEPEAALRALGRRVA